MGAGLRVIGIVLLGALSGVGGSAGFAWLSSRSHDEARNKGSDERSSSKTEPSEFPLVHRLGAVPLPTQSAGPVGKQPDDYVADHESAQERAVYEKTQQGRAERVELELQLQRNRLVAHQQEPREEAWANERERGVQARFGGDGLGTAKLQGIECRSVSCVAQLKWPDGEKAEREMMEVITELGIAAPGSIRHLTLDKEHGSDATVVFDWTQSKEGMGN